MPATTSSCRRGDRGTRRTSRSVTRNLGSAPVIVATADKWAYLVPQVGGGFDAGVDRRELPDALVEAASDRRHVRNAGFPRRPRAARPVLDRRRRALARTCREPGAERGRRAPRQPRGLDPAAGHPDHAAPTAERSRRDQRDLLPGPSVRSGERARRSRAGVHAKRRRSATRRLARDAWGAGRETRDGHTSSFLTDSSFSPTGRSSR